MEWIKCSERMPEIELTESGRDLIPELIVIKKHKNHVNGNGIEFRHAYYIDGRWRDLITQETIEEPFAWSNFKDQFKTTKFFDGYKE